MGLYLALVVFWIAGARNESLRLPALWSLTVFMLGLAAGRVVSLIVAPETISPPIRDCKLP